MPQILEEDTLIGEIFHQWEVKEYEEHNRNMFWYVFMLVVGLLLVGYALYSGNFLFALIIVIAAIIMFLQSYQKPMQVPIGITESGIIINDRLYSYSELEEFYVIYQPPEVKALFIETGSLRPRLRIPLMDEDPNDIRFTLREFLPENTEKEEEPFSDMIGRKWMLH